MNKEKTCVLTVTRHSPSIVMGVGLVSLFTTHDPRCFWVLRSKTLNWVNPSMSLSCNSVMKLPRARKTFNLCLYPLSTSGSCAKPILLQCSSYPLIETRHLHSLERKTPQFISDVSVTRHSKMNSVGITAIFTNRNIQKYPYIIGSSPVFRRCSSK